MGAEKTFNALPGWAKGAIAVATVAAVGISAYLIYKKVVAYNAAKNSKKEVDELNKEVAAEIKKGLKPSLTPSTIQAMANNIQTAMDGYGSDVGAITNNLVKVKNNLDMLALNKAWGIREISSGRGNPEPNFKGTLSQCLTNELSDKDISELNMVLAKKGVTRRI